MSEHARIRKITVSKLFGIFDHEIPLNRDERITIIHGPNGFGKTVILQMLEALSHGRWDALFSVPFERITFMFESRELFWVDRTASTSFHALTCNYVETVEGTAPIPVQAHQVVKRLHGGPTYAKRRAQEPPVEPDWLKALRKRLSTWLIRTQRLTHGQATTVEEYSQELANSIRLLHTSYANHSQELDSTFLNRLFQQEPSTTPSLTEALARLKHIEQNRAQLIALGFLDHEREPHKTQLKLDRSKLDVLSIYIDDMERKLAIFNEMAQKTQLLANAINKRFKYKRMSISPSEGFVFRSAVDDSLLPLASLSSGEQHELVLLYELLFKVEPNTLVLIDEPELSLHLAWQQQFLGDLMQIVKLSEFDALIATHSPAIIGKRWDLTVELKGPDLESAAQ